MQQLDIDLLLDSPFVNFDYYFKDIPKDGLILEFGVADGGSIKKIASLVAPRLVYGFDTFEGLPEDWEGYLDDEGKIMHPKGYFKGRPKEVPDNVKLIEGLFQDTLHGFLKEHPEPIALIHIDCDLYSSTKCVLTQIHDRIQEGSIFIFDEIKGYGGKNSPDIWKEHEWKAFNEFLVDTNCRMEYLGHHDYFAAGFKVSPRKE